MIRAGDLGQQGWSLLPATCACTDDWPAATRGCEGSFGTGHATKLVHSTRVNDKNPAVPAFFMTNTEHQSAA